MIDFHKMALALPLATEQDHFGGASFRVNGKIFAQLSPDRASGLVKLPTATQELAVTTYPMACLIEPGWGRYGWTRLILDKISEDLVAEYLSQSWRAVSPKKLHSLLSN